MRTACCAFASGRNGSTTHGFGSTCGVLFALGVGYTEIRALRAFTAKAIEGDFGTLKLVLALRVTGGTLVTDGRLVTGGRLDAVAPVRRCGAGRTSWVVSWLRSEEHTSVQSLRQLVC